MAFVLFTFLEPEPDKVITVQSQPFSNCFRIEQNETTPNLRFGKQSDDSSFLHLELLENDGAGTCWHDMVLGWTFLLPF